MLGLDQTDIIGVGEPFKIFCTYLHCNSQFFPTISSKNFRNTWIMRLHEYCMNINSLKNLRHPLNTKIYIGPDGRVLILPPDWGHTEQHSIIFDRNGSYFYSWASYFSFSNAFLRMDRHILQHAREVLERKEVLLNEEHKKNSVENRLVKLDNSLQKVNRMIAQHDENILHQFDMIMQRLDRLGANRAT